MKLAQLNLPRFPTSVSVPAYDRNRIQAWRTGLRPRHPPTTKSLKESYGIEDEWPVVSKLFYQAGQIGATSRESERYFSETQRSFYAKRDTT